MEIRSINRVVGGTESGTGVQVFIMASRITAVERGKLSGCVVYAGGDKFLIDEPPEAVLHQMGFNVAPPPEMELAEPDPPEDVN